LTLLRQSEKGGKILTQALVLLWPQFLEQPTIMLRVVVGGVGSCPYRNEQQQHRAD